MRLLFGNTAEFSSFRCLYFRSISMAVLGNIYDGHEKTRKYKQQDKKPQLATG